VNGIPRISFSRAELLASKKTLLADFQELKATGDYKSALFVKGCVFAINKMEQILNE
jgi:hypothetical protein